MTIIQTERLLLQQVHLKDAAFIYELLNSPGWIEFIGDRGVHSLADAAQYIKKSFLDSYEKNGFGLYKMVLKASNEPIGLCGLVNRPSLEDIDIGFALLSSYVQKGYAYEAAAATMDYATTKLGLTKIVAITTKENHASQKLLKKIGFEQVDLIQMEGEELFLLSYEL